MELKETIEQLSGALENLNKKRDTLDALIRNNIDGMPYSKVRILMRLLFSVENHHTAIKAMLDNIEDGDND